MREKGELKRFYHRPGHRIRHQLARHHPRCLYVIPLSVFVAIPEFQVQEEHWRLDEDMSKTYLGKNAYTGYKNIITDPRSLLHSRRVQERPPQPCPQDCHQAPLNAQPWVLDWTTSGVIKQDG